MTKASKKREGRSPTSAVRASDGGDSGGGTLENPAASKQRAKGLHGVPGSKNDSRRCTAIANRSGERCKAAAIKGGTVCRVHGGSLPGVKAAARDRLLALVDPALVELRKILDKADASDTDKLRAIQLVLDRAGFRPGLDVQFKPPTAWDNLDVEQIFVDRSLPAGPDELGPGWQDLQQHAKDAQAKAWAGLDREDAEPYTTRLDPYDGNTVRGEVVDEGPPEHLR